MSYPPAGPPPAEGPFTAPSATSNPAPSPYPGLPGPPPPPPAPAWSGPPQYGQIPAPADFPRPAGVWQAIVASAAVVLVVISHFWEVSRLSSQAALMEDIEAGKNVTLAEARASDSSLNHAVLLQVAMALIAVVLVMVWAYYARSNAGRYTQSPFRRSKGWAIGSWICPIVCLWFPFQVVKDIWAASDIERPDVFTVKAWHVNPIVAVWWTCLLSAGVVQRISDSVYNNGDSASDVHTALILDFASAAVEIAAAITFILIVAAITRFQTQRYEAFRAGASPQPGALTA